MDDSVNSALKAIAVLTGGVATAEVAMSLVKNLQSRPAPVIVSGGGVDYTRLKEVIKEAQGEVQDDVKLATRFGIKDLNLSSTDPPLAIPSGVEADFGNVDAGNKIYVYGVFRVHGNLTIEPGGCITLGPNGVLEFVR